MNDLQEKPARLWVEDENCAVDRLCSQISFESLVNRHSVHVGVIYKPDNLVRKQLGVVLRVQIGLGWLARVQLEALPNSFSQHVQSGVGLHDLVHCLLQELFAVVEPVSKATVQVVGQVNREEGSCG